ncbi:MAG: hypothetical protein ACE5I2_07395 [Anaerolineae bacterium]
MNIPKVTQAVKRRLTDRGVEGARSISDDSMTLSVLLKKFADMQVHVLNLMDWKKEQKRTRSISDDHMALSLALKAIEEVQVEQRCLRALVDNLVNWKQDQARKTARCWHIDCGCDTHPAYLRGVEAGDDAGYRRGLQAGDHAGYLRGLDAGSA